MASYLQYIYNSVLDIFFPRVCFRCGIYQNYLCNVCQLQIPRNLSQRCIMCQKPSANGWTHQQCTTSTSPDRLITIFEYTTHPVSKIITQGKYNFIPSIFTLLGHIASTELLIPTTASLTPIPLHKKRQRWRGFNQTHIIAQAISASAGIPIHPIVTRSKYTTPQKELNKEKRNTNLNNAFILTTPITTPIIILIDDVTTTGSTFKEVTQTIKLKTEAEIWCLAIAQD